MVSTNCAQCASSRACWLAPHERCTKKALLVIEHRRFAFADRQCLTAMCNQPKQLLRILHIFVAYLTIGDCKFQIGAALEHVP